jgi:chitinase
MTMSPTTLRLTLFTALIVLLLSAESAAGAPLYTVERIVSPTGSGQVLLDPEKTGYAKNNIVAVTARPASASWKFDHWEGSVSGTQNPTTLRIGGNAVVKAFFVDSSTPPDPGVNRPPLPTSRMVVGYFTQWSIYRRNFLLRDVDQALKAVEAGTGTHALNVINYAFAAPDETLKCASLDTFADYGKRFDASESVDGVADTVAQPLKGNFNQLLKLKKNHPELRVLISLGGWTQSSRFSDAALPANRAAFVASCVDMFVRGKFAAGIVAPGVFDGIDLDWEYPGSCGATCNFRTDDAVNFPALLAEFRRQLEIVEDEVQAATGKRPEYLLSIAAPAGAAHYEPIDLAAIHESLDWINVMAYDFHGSWETAGPANHHAALLPSSCEPANGDWADKAVRHYLGPTAGVPASKLVLGVPFYGRGWRTAAVDDGLCVPATGIPRGTYEKGIEDYDVLDTRSSTDHWDEATATHWIFNGSEFWSFDDPQSLGWKADYVNGKAMRGMMFWELSGDAPDGRLLNALRSRLGSVQ